MLTLKCAFLIAFMALKVSALANLEEVFAWQEMSFAWPNEETRNAAVKEGDYVPANNLLLGVDRWKNKMFVTIPRWKSGVPASLGYIPLDEPINKTAAIIPYPDWKTNALPKGNVKPQDGNYLVSVFRVWVDACDRLWVLDTRKADLLGKVNEISNPAILIYDLNTDRLIRTYTLKRKDLHQNSFFANIVVDVNKDKCDEAFAYNPDGFGIVVYSLKDNDSWRIEHNFFSLEPLQGNFSIAGVNFQYNDGVFGVALGPAEKNSYRTIYFHPFSGLNEFSVNSSVLRNKTLANDDNYYNKYANSDRYNEFKLLGSKGEMSQSSGSIFDTKSNTLFLTQLHKDGFSCWNPKRELIPENVALLAQDHEKLIYTNELRIDADRNLWIVSDKMPRFIFGKLNGNEINYRIFKVNVDDAIAGTPCVT